MGARRETVLWIGHRVTAMVLAACVLVHLGTMIYAVRGGLTAAEILGRTRGSLGWGVFYGTFVVAAAIHGALGMRTVFAEWLGFRGDAAEVVTTAIGVALTLLGLRAVIAVVGT